MTGAIREELESVLRDERVAAPYVRAGAGERGTLSDDRRARGCPLNRLPQRSPSVLVSLLKPRTHIPPHNGLVNTRLICHLPLIVPAGCRFRVGNETRVWEEGKAWVFDDSINHEAWNDSDQTRVILLFEIWRPELSERERELVQALFASLDANSGQKPAWEI